MDHLIFSFKSFQNLLISLSSHVGGPRRAMAGGCGSLLIIAITCCCCALLLAPISDKRTTPTLANTATSAPPTANIQPIERPKATVTLSQPGKTPLPSTSTDIPAPTNTFASTATKPAPTNTKLPTPTWTPAPPSPTSTQSPSPITESGFNILVLTSPIKAGEKATVQVQSVPGASCSLAYTTPSGSHSSAKGLGETIADSNGVCSWTWKISASTKTGTGKLTITINDVTQSLDIVIQQ
jgi:hypothetical protein